jgi:type IV pilus assembly protein PilA
VHANGGSLAKSQQFLASLPPGESPNASAVFYQNAAALAALQLKALSPALADSVANSSNLLPGSVIRLYGEELAIREASLSGPLDVTAPLIVAAVAVPSLLRSRVAANEASAVGSLRSVNVAQVTYQTTYPKRGFAPDLASLGTPPGGGSTTTPERANLLAEPLAESSCTGDAWCIKSGYQFRIKASCKLHMCTEYVAVATPVSAETGNRSFCSTSDAVIHFQSGPPLTAPLTAADCQKWPPLQ